MMRTNYFLETILIAGRVKTLTAFGLLAAMVALLSFGAPTLEPAHAQIATDPQTFTVNSTADAADKTRGDGRCFTGTLVDFGEGAVAECTLRAAIEQANANPGDDAIHFNIPDDPNVSGNEVKTISIPADSNPLPRITDTVTIDGYSQPGATPNTQEVGNDAALLIELHNPDAAPSGPQQSFPGHGLELVRAPNSLVRGLVINGFFSGVRVASDGIRVEGNFLGTDPSGTNVPNFPLPQEEGVYVADGAKKNVTIGGTSPDTRNLISGNDFGILINKGASGVRILGNYIGTTRDGTGDLGNDAHGLLILGNNNVVGGNPVQGKARAANVIAFNKGAGVEVVDGIGNRILSNSIHSNDLRGILLCCTSSPSEVRTNDPGDPDKGPPNNWQNYPELTSAVLNGDGTVTISGKLDSTRGRTFSLQFFSSPEADPSGFGEGKTLLFPHRDFPMTINREGTNLKFVIANVVPLQPLSSGDYITATATDDTTGDTSEFSNAVVLQEAVWGTG